MTDREFHGGERFTIELEALADSVPPIARLRRWLKGALRAGRFRALSVRETTPRLPALPAQQPATPAEPVEDQGGEQHEADGASGCGEK
jgi:hypothetical protein